jgi:hypothetical protein
METSGGDLVPPAAEAPPPRGEGPWTPEALLERIDALMASPGRSDPLLGWLLQRLAHAGEPLPAHALATLLQSEDRTAIELFLEDVSHLALMPIRAQVGKAIAARIPRYRTISPDLEAAALTALTSLGPSRHFEILRDALASPETRVAEAALIGIAAARGPEGAHLLFDFLLSTREKHLASLALGGLILAGDEEQIAAGTTHLLEMGASPGNHAFGIVSIISSLEGAGFSSAAMFCVYEAVCGFAGLEAREGRFRILLPGADPAARRRAAALLPPERLAEIARLSRRENWRKLRGILEETALEAVRVASEENPGFADLGRRIASCIRSASKTRRFEALDEVGQSNLVALHGTFLAKAIRGRDMRREIEEAGELDRERVLDLLRVDEPWLDAASFREAATHAREEDLLALAETPDLFVRTNCRFLLLAIDPERHLQELLDDREVYPLGWNRPLLRWAMEDAGDRLCDAAAARALEEDAGDARGVFAAAVTEAATHRASHHLARAFDGLLDTVPAAQLIEAVLAAGTAGMAERLLDELPRGGLECTLLRFDKRLSAKIRTRAAALAALHGLREPLEEDVTAGLALFKERVQQLFDARERGRTPFDRFLPDGRLIDLAMGRTIPDRLPEPDPLPEPLRRDAPKIGRNDPCPCGSGKKYKRCCESEREPTA